MYRQPENQGLDSRLFESIVNTNIECNYHELLGIYIKTVQPGICVLTMDIQDRLINPQNIAHGGAMFSLADTAIGMATRSKNRIVRTLESSINFLHPVRLGDTLSATGTIVSFGSKIIVGQAEIVNQNNTPVAVMTGTFYNKEKLFEELD